MRIKQNIYILFLLLLLLSNIYAYDLKGIILDIHTQEPLNGANIQVFEEEKYTFSDNSGYFSIKNIELDEVELKISYIGYKTQKLLINFDRISGKTQKIYLEPSLIKFEAVRVEITKSDKTLSGSSLPIVLVDENTLSKKLTNEVSSAIASEPGISVSGDGVWGKTISIRGLSKNNLVMLVDGNRISTATNLAAALSMVDINDVERIETIKSGASSLYGSGATGGVINIITKKAEYGDFFYAKPSLKIGFNSVNSMHYENLSILTGAKKWNAKLSFQNRVAQDAETPKGTLDNSQFEDQNISANINIKPLENHELSLNYQNFNAENVGLPGGKPLFPDNADVRYVEAYRELYSVKYTIKNIIPILPKLSFKVYQQNIFRDVENIPHIIKTMPTVPVKQIHMLKIAPNALHETSGFQIVSNWLLLNNNFLTAGIDGWEKSLKSRRQKTMEIHVLNDDGETIKTIDQLLGELPLPDSKYSTAGIFINDDHYFMNKKLLINIGGRIDMIKINSKEAWNPDYQIVNGVRTDHEDIATSKLLWDAEDDQDVSWSANMGLLYKPMDHWNFKLNLSKSFRSPTLTERFNFIDLGNLVELGDPELDSETSFSTDLGIKYLDEKYSAGLNLFHNDMQNLVVEKAEVIDGKNYLINTNAGEAILYGYELFGSAELPYNFSISANLSYVHAEDTKYDEPLALIPPINGQFIINYRYRNLLNFSAEMSAFGDQDRIADWEIETPGYAYFNFLIYTNNFNLFNTNNQIFFRIDNLTDRAYRNHLSTNRGTMLMEPGRNFGISWKIGL